MLEKLVKKLLPLGFSRSAILHELSQSGGDIEIAATRLIEENVMGNNEEQPLIKLDRIMVCETTIVTFLSHLFE